MRKWPDSAVVGPPEPPVYVAEYRGRNVHELMVRGIRCQRRTKDGWVNASGLLKVAGIELDDSRAEELLREEVLKKWHIPGKEKLVDVIPQDKTLRGIWIPFTFARELAQKYDIFEDLRPLLDGPGCIEAINGIDTIPTIPIVSDAEEGENDTCNRMRIQNPTPSTDCSPEAANANVGRMDQSCDISRVNRGATRGRARGGRGASTSDRGKSKRGKKKIIGLDGVGEVISPAAEAILERKPNSLMEEKITSKLSAAASNQNRSYCFLAITDMNHPLSEIEPEFQTFLVATPTGVARTPSDAALRTLTVLNRIQAHWDKFDPAYFQGLHKSLQAESLNDNPAPSPHLTSTIEDIATRACSDLNGKGVVKLRKCIMRNESRVLQAIVKKHLASREEALKETQKKLASVQASETALNQQVGALQGRIRSLEEKASHNTRMEADIRRLIREAEGLRTEVATAKEEKQKAMSQSKDQLQRLQEALNRYKSDCDQLRSIQADSKEKWTQREGEILQQLERLKAEVANRDIQLLEANSQRISAEQRASQISREHAIAVEKAAQNAQHNLEELKEEKNKVAQLEEEISSLKEKLEAVEEERKTAMDLLEAGQQREDSNESLLIQKEEEIQRLRRDRIELLDIVKKLHTQSDQEQHEEEVQQHPLRLVREIEVSQQEITSNLPGQLTDYAPLSSVDSMNPADLHRYRPADFRKMLSTMCAFAKYCETAIPDGDGLEQIQDGAVGDMVPNIRGQPSTDSSQMYHTTRTSALTVTKHPTSCTSAIASDRRMMTDSASSALCSPGHSNQIIPSKRVLADSKAYESEGSSSDDETPVREVIIREVVKKKHKKKKSNNNEGGSGSWMKGILSMMVPSASASNQHLTDNDD